MRSPVLRDAIVLRIAAKRRQLFLDSNSNVTTEARICDRVHIPTVFREDDLSEGHLYPTGRDRRD